MHRVFVDANVLGSKTLYDWLFLLRRQLPAVFSLSTTDDVLDEAHRVWRRRHPKIGGAMRAKRDKLFREYFDEITSDWHGQVTSAVDVDDSHVHNAAVDLEVDILLTNNVKDFAERDDISHDPPYDVYTPDEFFCLIYENNPDAVRAVAGTQLGYWLRRAEADPGVEQKSLAVALEGAGCPNFAQKVNECLMIMSGSGEVRR